MNAILVPKKCWFASAYPAQRANKMQSEVFTATMSTVLRRLVRNTLLVRMIA